MEPCLQTVIAIFSSVLASSGLWAYIMKRHDSRSSANQMLIGLGHDRIVYLGMKYIERNERDGKGITQDEYENMYEYLYKPYRALGGNGSAERVMEEVKKLPIHK